MFNTISTANERFLADLSNLEGRLLTAQRQVSSGLRMQSVADDPDQVSALLAVKAQIAHNSQLKYNLGRVQTEVNAAENAINTAATLMDRARQIAAQGASSTTTVDTRTQLAGQVKDIITEMFGLTQTQVEGRYVFSGDSDQTPPSSTWISRNRMAWARIRAQAGHARWNIQMDPFFRSRTRPIKCSIPAVYQAAYFSR